MGRIFIACGLTMLIETGFFILVGKRMQRDFILLCLCANALTNLSLNLLVWLLFYTVTTELSAVIYLFEVCVIIAEFLIYGAYEGRSRKLFLLTVASNAVSYITGLLIFGHI